MKAARWLAFGWLCLAFGAAWAAVAVATALLWLAHKLMGDRDA